MHFRHLSKAHLFVVGCGLLGVASCTNFSRNQRGGEGKGKGLEGGKGWKKEYGKGKGKEEG